MSNESLDKEAGAIAVAPRVTLDHIESLIESVTYYNPAKVLSKCDRDALPISTVTALSCLTICVIVLKNGFTVTGESACASPENFDLFLGRKIARENAVKKIWPLEAYVLRNMLTKAAY